MIFYYRRPVNSAPFDQANEIENLHLGQIDFKPEIAYGEMGRRALERRVANGKLFITPRGDVFRLVVVLLSTFVKRVVGRRRRQEFDLICGRHRLTCTVCKIFRMQVENQSRWLIGWSTRFH